MQVNVYVDGVQYCVDNDYGLELTFKWVEGWTLWKNWEGVRLQIGNSRGQYNFCVTVNDQTVVGEFPQAFRPAEIIGTNGTIQ